MHIQKACKQSLLLRYEDMINDFEPFAFKLSSFLKLKRGITDKLYEQSRPLEKEDQQAHRRSGMTGGYLTKLSSQTIKFINDHSADTLSYYLYNNNSYDSQ
jgi:hypothetical protein